LHPKAGLPLEQESPSKQITMATPAASSISELCPNLPSGSMIIGKRIKLLPGITLQKDEISKYQSICKIGFSYLKR